MANTQNPISQTIRFAALAVDVICFQVIDGKLKLLLGKVDTDNNVFKGYWAHIGGLIEKNETAEQSVDRLLKNKAGMTGVYKEQLYTFSAVHRDPRGRVVAVAYLALTDSTHPQDLDHAKTETVWEEIKKASKLAYDHDEMVKVALQRLQAKIMYTDIAKHLMPKEFTLSDLQKVYELILGEGMDKRNFRKRMLSLNLLKDTKRTVKKGVMRPASLYTFK
ncbi:MAG: hypothetical protein RJB39_655 [Candidatus Parcubacteria bacterium]|jgi:8-oxo-dGTP diphosphatase